MPDYQIRRSRLKEIGQTLGLKDHRMDRNVTGLETGMAEVLTVRGIVRGKQIDLESETGLPSGAEVMVIIRAMPLTLEQKRRLTDQLCGSWADDASLPAIFAEIAHERHKAVPRDVEFDAAP